MDEQAIKRLSLLCALVGLAGLWILSVQPLVTGSIASASQQTSSQVLLCGVVSQVRVSKAGHVFFTLTDASGSLAVVAFNRIAAREGLSPGLSGRQCFAGKIQQYRNQPELVVERREVAS